MLGIKKQKTKSLAILEISQEITKVRSELKSAQSAFCEATNPLLINSYIYQLKALDAKHCYLLEQAKKSFI